MTLLLSKCSCAWHKSSQENKKQHLLLLKINHKNGQMMNGNTEREASKKGIAKDSKKKMAENKVTAKKKYFSLKKIIFLSHEKLS